MRYFNTEGSCRLEEHYMVRLDDRMEKIKKLYVDRRKYFVINKGRQYGKTTTLLALKNYLAKEYMVFSLDFQRLGTKDFTDEITFSRSFIDMISTVLRNVEEKEDLLKPLRQVLSEDSNYGLKELFAGLSSMCENSPRPIVLMIDEVDSASNNQVFVDFLAQLRGCYLNRDETPIFHSVILAGVYDIKNLKLKLRPESEHQYNSPWNIAADFKINMSFSTDQIMAMLEEYENDYHTGMDTQVIAEEIYAYTSGYPVLVSIICKFIDEELPDRTGFEDPKKAWSKEGIEQAVKNILKERMPLFDSMMRHIDEYSEMKQMLHAILFEGRAVAYNPDNKAINLACMFGYTTERENRVQVANRIFEMRLYNFFLSEEELTNMLYGEAQSDQNYFIHDGRLDMDLILERFVVHFTDIYGSNGDKFIEDNGRKFFLLYLKPIINGVGNYYIEAQTRDARRTDVIVDYHGEQFVVEMKIWHGEEYNKRGERQLTDYLDYFHLDKGYMLSFNFNKQKEIGVKTIMLDDKMIVEAVV
ncbi:MAG: AAA-like domain-containing protein [Lachnospiraceae bacterium]|nr:AAA-like domain-containing protein [Lachnospiraceae bacterium]